MSTDQRTNRVAVITASSSGIGEAVAGRVAGPGSAVYNATKWGLGGWSEAMRQELQPGVRVTIIEPGAVATELTDHIRPTGQSL